jgi:hypothetical protein
MAGLGQVTVAREEFGVDAESKATIFLYRWRNSRPDGLEVAVSTWGATVVSVRSADRQGNLAEVTLNHSDLRAIQMQRNYYGATIGRVASTLAGARFQLEGKEFKLSANVGGKHHAHGGFCGFDKVIWAAEELPPPVGQRMGAAAAVRFSYLSVDGEEGYPGAMATELTVCVTDDDELCLEYRAVVDKPSPVNLTNHTYWNLSGNCVATVLDHRLWLNSKAIQANPPESSRLHSIQGSVWDFRGEAGAGELIGRRIKAVAAAQAELAKSPEGIPGYDNVYALEWDAAPQQRAGDFELQGQAAAVKERAEAVLENTGGMAAGRVAVLDLLTGLLSREERLAPRPAEDRAQSLEHAGLTVAVAGAEDAGAGPEREEQPGGAQGSHNVAVKHGPRWQGSAGSAVLGDARLGDARMYPVAWLEDGHSGRRMELFSNQVCEMSCCGGELRSMPSGGAPELIFWGSAA